MQAVTFDYDVLNPAPGVYLPLPTSVVNQMYTSGSSDFTQTTSYVYDDFGNPKQTQATTTDGGAALYTFEDYNNDPDKWLLGYKRTRKLTSDGDGHQILSSEQMDYDPTTWDVTTYDIWDDQHQRWLTTTYVYDSFGNRITETDPSGAVETTKYDSTYQTFVAQKVSPVNQSGDSQNIHVDYNPGFGIWRAQTDPNGVERNQSVDGLGRLSTAQGPDPDGQSVVLTQHTWAQDNQGIYRETQILIDWSNQQWTWKRDYLDGFGRMYQTQTLADDGVRTVTITRQFDSHDRITQESLPFYATDTPVYIEMSYDEYGRLMQRTTPADGGPLTTTRLDYVSANHVVQTEAYNTADARATDLRYSTFNSQRQLVQRTDASGATTLYSYDALSRRISVHDPIAVTTTVAYDSIGRQVAISVRDDSQSIWSETFDFDDVQRQVTRVDGNNVATVQTYDGLKRLLSRTVTGEQPTLWAYDLAGYSNGQGRLCTVSMPDGSSYAYEYDAFGNQTRIELQIDAQSYGFQKAYTPAGEVQRILYPDGSQQTNAYTAASRLMSVDLNNLTYASFDNFTAFGWPQLQAYPRVAPAQDTFLYNSAGQLSSQQVQGAGGNLLINTCFHWSLLDELTSIDDLLDASKNQSFKYDPVGRLSQATGSYLDQSFGYDDGGNLTHKNGVVFTYDGYQPRSGTLNGQAVFNATFDSNGNLLTATRSGVESSYQYDPEGRLSQSGSAGFTYDYAGRRLKKQLTNGPTTYYVAPYYEVTRLVTGAVQHTIQLEGTYGTFASITTVDSGTVDPASAQPGVPIPGTFYFHKNQINSTTVQTDTAGDAVTRVEYLPYGEIASLSGPDTLRQKFTGKELDVETGLYYFGARYYDPWLGRFTAADDRLGGHSAYRDAFNRYAYVLNSPVYNVDPTGHFSWDWWKALGQHVLMYTADVGLIAAGAVVLAGGTLIGAGLAATLVGSTLLGAGIGGLAYNITQDIQHKPLSWGDWGVQLGIGAAVGLVGGALGASAGFVARSAEIGAGFGRAIFNTVGGAAIGAITGAGGQMLNNAAQHAWWASGVGSATLMGLGFGLIASGATELVSRAPVLQRPPSAEEVGEIDRTLARQGSHYETFAPSAEIRSQDYNRVFDDTPWNRFVVSWPGTVFNVLNNAIWDMGWHPRW
jgi:RHS repeat-associated protein